MHYYDIIVTVLITHSVFIRLVIQSALSVLQQKEATESQVTAAHLSVGHRRALGPAVLFIKLSKTLGSLPESQKVVDKHVLLLFLIKIDIPEVNSYSDTYNFNN